LTRTDYLRQWTWFKIQAGWRYGLTRALAQTIPLYIVNEYPRSGGTWLSQMLSRAMGVHFQRLGLVRPFPSVIHAHYRSPFALRNVCILWRDGRDALVSLYHHLYFSDDVNNSLVVDTTRRRLPLKDPALVKENLPKFIEAVFEKKISPARFTWDEFVRNWIDRPGVAYARYEDLRAQTLSEIKRICSTLSRDVSDDCVAHAVEEFSFERVSGRPPGQENKHSFLRRGVVGDWRNYFTRESCQVFDKYAGRELITLKYEKDRDWAQAFG
jgi:hypothetical protein